MSPRSVSGLLRVEWRVGNLTSFGTGFLVANNGRDYLITAAHIVEDETGKLYLMFEDGTPVPFTAKRMYKEKGLDAVAVEVADVPSFVPRYTTGILGVGDTVAAYGFPEAKGRFEVRGDVVTRVIEASCRIQNGMSGGPLMVNGKVVGVLSSRVFKSDGTEASIHSDMTDVLGMINGR